MCVDTRHTKIRGPNIVDAFLIAIGSVMTDAKDMIKGADEKSSEQRLGVRAMSATNHIAMIAINSRAVLTVVKVAFRERR